MRKNEVFVLTQPKHTVAHIVYIDSDTFPIKDSIHESLGMLAEQFDLMFVFSDHHNNNLEHVDKKKFSSLYQACCYIDSPYKSLGRSTIRLMSYCREIFQKHSSFIFSRLQDLDKITKEDVEKLILIGGSTISRPIFIPRRLESWEMFKIYETKNKQYNNIVFSFFSNLFEKYIEERDLIGMYSIWHTNSNVLYFRSNFIDLILKDSSIQSILDTFEDEDPRYMLASITKKLGIDTLSLELKDIKL